jgi:hypothetical protein
LLASREERDARAARHLLAERLSAPDAADLLAAIVRREERRQRTRHVVFRAVAGAIVTAWAAVMLSGIVCGWPGAFAPFANIPVYAFIAVSACFYGRWGRGAPLLVRAALALGERGDGRALAPLLRLSFHLNNFSDRCAATQAFRLVPPLLARLQPSDRTSEAMLPPAERDALLRALRLRYPSNVGYHDGRLLFYGPRPTFASDDEADAYVALVETFGRIGNGDAVPVLATIAESAAETEREQRVVRAADECLTRLCRRA